MWHKLMLVATISLSIVSGLAQETENKILKQIKRDSRVFENIIHEVLRENFDNPFAIAAEPRAVFLNGYGLSVTFQIKINRGRIRGPWGDIDNPWTKQSTPKEEQVTVIKTSMIRALADYGNTVKHLGKRHRITICAHIEDLNEIDKSKSRTVLLISALGSDIQEFTTAGVPFEMFSKKVEVMEY